MYEVMIGLLVFFVIVIVAAEIVRRWLWGRLFKRLGERAWKAWVPVVDLWTVFKLGHFPGWFSPITYLLLAVLLVFAYLYPENPPPYVFFLLIPLLPLVVVSLIAIYRITKQLGMHGALFLVYMFVGELIWLIVANAMKPGDSRLEVK